MDDYNSISNSFDDYLGSAIIEWKIGYNKIIELANIKKDEKILDFGCGSGKFAYELAKLGAEVVGLDNADDMIRVANEKHAHKNIRYLTGSDEMLKEFQDYFDVATSNFVLCTYDSKEKLLLTLQRLFFCLKNLGTVLFLQPNRDYSNGISFSSFDYVYKDNLKDGMPINTILKGGGKEIFLTDTFWTQETYCNLIEEAGFTVEMLYNTYADKNDPVLELEKYKSPFYIIKARKIIKEI